MIDETLEPTQHPRENRAKETSVQPSASETSGRIGRRSALKVIGVAAIPLATQSVRAETSSGYGEAGYGSGGYGGSSDGDGEEDYEGEPTIETFTAAEDSPPNPHAEIHVEWAVSEPVSELERVSIDVFDTEDLSEPVDTESISVDGSSAAGEETIRIKRGSGTLYRVAFTVRNAVGGEVSAEKDVRAR